VRVLRSAGGGAQRGADSRALNLVAERRGLALRIAGTAGLILFLELALIRFLGAYVRVFAFFTNFVIIAAFLGMGAGMLRRAAHERLRWAFPPVLLALLGTVAYLSRTPIDAGQTDLEWLWFIPERGEQERPVPLIFAVVALFALVTAAFVPLGAMLGSAMSRWRALPAYAADLGGSLVGVLTFAMMSRWELSPTVWFSCVGIAFTCLALPQRRFVATTLVAGAGAVGLVSWIGSQEPEIWSPYYRITTGPAAGHVGSTQIDVNGALHQVMLDFSATATDARMDSVRKAYEQPYLVVGALDTVLVVGAGSGNDVALLLARGARHIDAVEIDPAIARIGRERHPLRPYDDPRVHLIIADARAFLRAPPHRYDVIVFGTLDSHTLLGGASSVRLDNYVYTQESFRAARAALRPGGSLILYHLSGFWFIAARLQQNLAAAFDAPPGVFLGSPYHFNYTFVAGAAATAAPTVASDSHLHMPLKLATDDWPYPYLRSRRLPVHYVVAISAVVIIGLTTVTLAAGRQALRAPDWPLFLLGSGFLLLETKGITTMSLLFGSTWTVNAAVIAAILAVALLATVLVEKMRAPSVMLAMGVLGALLAASVVVQPASLVSLAPGMRWIAAAVYVGLPVFFASVLFSRAYGNRPNPTGALAFNILGAVAGGVLEYSSMAFGLDALNWIALGAYISAVWLLAAEQRRVPAGTGGELKA
jgi:hypothetical protein